MGMVLLALYLHSRPVASDKPYTIIEYSTKIDIYIIYYIDNDFQK